NLCGFTADPERLIIEKLRVHLKFASAFGTLITTGHNLPVFSECVPAERSDDATTPHPFHFAHPETGRDLADKAANYFRKSRRHYRAALKCLKRRHSAGPQPDPQSACAQRRG